MTSARTGATAAALTATLALAAASWVVAVRQVHGMDLGVGTGLGSFAFFVALWVSMMLPGAAPAVLRLAHAGGLVLTVPLFVGSYLAVWTLVGVAVYALAQELPPSKAIVDVPLALAIVGLGILIVVAPSSVPGRTPPI